MLPWREVFQMINDLKMYVHEVKNGKQHTENSLTARTARLHLLRHRLSIFRDLFDVNASAV